jgi:hypothetical protein
MRKTGTRPRLLTAFAPKSTAWRNAWPTIRANSPLSIRLSNRARAKKFPYALLFLIQLDALLVIACFHSSRDPTAELAEMQASGERTPREQPDLLGFEQRNDVPLDVTARDRVVAG